MQGECLVVGTESIGARPQMETVAGLPTGTVMVFHVGRDSEGYPTTKLLARHVTESRVQSCCTIKSVPLSLTSKAVRDLVWVQSV